VPLNLRPTSPSLTRFVVLSRVLPLTQVLGTVPVANFSPVTPWVPSMILHPLVIAAGSLLLGHSLILALGQPLLELLLEEARHSDQ
jgi:hypothetical protein